MGIGQILNNTERPLKERFRALFTLKNIGGQEAINEISKSFQDKSELLKHEVAYCLGQMGDKNAIPILSSVLQDLNQEPIVRHEAGEASEDNPEKLKNTLLDENLSLFKRYRAMFALRN